jgi:hypothetical protein
LPTVRPLIDLNEALEWEYYNFCYLILDKGYTFVWALILVNSNWFSYT